MKRNIKIAATWGELNEWQLEEISDLYLSSDEGNFSKNFMQMLLVLFQKKKGFFSRMKLLRLLRNIPLSVLSPFGQFLLEAPKLGRFPNIKGLKKPADRLSDLSIKHFSYCDTFFYEWITTKDETSLKRLVASLYRIGDFDEQNLPKIAAITDKISNKKRRRIGLAFISCNEYIAGSFPLVFSRKKSENAQVKKKHTPFSEVILSLAISEDKPLGNLHQCNKTRIYEFLQVLSRTIMHYENRKRHEK